MKKAICKKLENKNTVPSYLDHMSSLLILSSWHFSRVSADSVFLWFSEQLHGYYYYPSLQRENWDMERLNKATWWWNQNSNLCLLYSRPTPPTFTMLQEIITWNSISLNRLCVCVCVCVCVCLRERAHVNIFLFPFKVLGIKVLNQFIRL